MTRTSILVRTFALCLLLTALLPAQRGNGAPGAFISATTAPIGGVLELRFGNSATPFAPSILSISDGFGPVPLAGVGDLWLDITSPAYQVFQYPTNANGEVVLQAPIPFDPALYGATPIFANALSFTGLAAPGFSLSKTVRIQFDTIDGFRPAGQMLEPRANHTATLLAGGPADNVSEVFIAGGGIGSIIVPVPSATTEIWSPLTRSFRPGPGMILPRLAHTATRLQDGRVLITGGVSSSGRVTSTCEIFDPISETSSPAASMAASRGGHAATLLPDGRVLVSGGFADWQNAAINFVAALNSAQDSTEIYDPVTNTWSTGPLMATARAGHGQVLLGTGNVLIVGGIAGGALVGSPLGGGNGQVPVHSWLVDSFDPATDTITARANMVTPRAYFGISELPNGNVLVTGGSVQGVPQIGSTGPGPAVASNLCEVFDGATWSAAPPMATTSAFHTHVRSRWNGDAIIMGGFIGDFTQLQGTSSSARHSGALYGQTLALGLHTREPGSSPAGRGTHTCTELQDGSYLIVGGASWPSTFTDAWTVVEPR